MLCLAVIVLIQHCGSFLFSFENYFIMRKSFRNKDYRPLLNLMSLHSLLFLMLYIGERYDPEPKSKWDEEWDKNKSAFPFSDKLGELSDKIGSTIDDTISKFRRKDREDSPEILHRYII